MRATSQSTLSVSVRAPGRSCAFTLSELLTVIAVIGVLAALVCAALSRGVGLAQRIKCANNIRQIGVALQMFVVEKHVYLLIAIDYSDHYQGWENQLSQAELDGSPTHNNSKADYPPPGIWHCPGVASMPKEFPWYPDYGYNAYGMSPPTAVETVGLGGHHIWGPPEYQPAPPVADSEVVAPSEMIAVGDGFKGNNDVIQDGWYILWRTYDLYDRPEYAGGTKRAYSRHLGEANVLFCDLHIESPKLKVLFDDRSDAALARWNRDHKPHRECLQP
jgi:prepilin-type N-terminal cleavage/methylation domain-containing protein/prepilin-type processing-associated H-X9-DG protein